MKRAAALIFAAFLVVFPLAAYGADSIIITVVIPESEPPPAPPPPRDYLYPVSVRESQENGRREVVRTYELAGSQRSSDISREAFVRDGWLFELADITRRETSETTTREHSRPVTLETATNDMPAILGQLAQTVEYRASDGYTGTLSLDIASIRVEVAGTRSVSSVVSATREYPHLSSNDTSLIPQTITENGNTFTLSNVEWRVQNTVTIDYFPIAESFTAVATYTRTAWRTVATGYVTTAQYHGTLSRTTPGDTVYTAYFIGVPIVSPVVSEPPSAEPETSSKGVTKEADEPPIEAPPGEPPVMEVEMHETPDETGQICEIEAEEAEYEGYELEIEIESELTQNAFNPFPILLALSAGIVVGGGIVFAIIKLNKKKGAIIEYEEEID